MSTPVHRRSIALIVLLSMLVLGCAGASTATDVAVQPAAAEPAANNTSTADDTTTSSDPTPAPDPGETAHSADADPAEAAPPPAQTGDAPDATPEPTATTDIPEFVPPTGIVPARIEIPTIGVDAPTIDLSLAGAEPEVPVDFDDTGWYTQTRLPGEIGPAVIAGHIDSRSGPAVFARLDQLVPGDEIVVYDDRGESRTFEVVDAAQYPKGDLPDSVFGFGTPEPELRLITCGGTFDADAGHYRDNYVVFARLVSDDTDV